MLNLFKDVDVTREPATGQKDDRNDYDSDSSEDTN